MAVQHSDYPGCPWLPGGDSQTIAPALWFKKPEVEYRREIWATPDDDVLAVDFSCPAPEAEDAPVMVHFHGLEGSSNSHYAKALMKECAEQGWRGMVVHYRGCGGLPNKKLRAYNAGDAPELDWIFRRVKEYWPKAPVFSMGVSLGANNLLFWAGTREEDALPLVNGIVAVCSPLDLKKSHEFLHTGVRNLYCLNFLTTLKQKALAKEKDYPDALDYEAIRKCRSIMEFDDLVTAPIHGYKNALDYWTRCSSISVLKGIKVPTLMINPQNDPFIRPYILPRDEDLSSAVTAEFPKNGGHCGFPTGPFPGSIGYLPKRTLRFCREHLV